MRFFTKIIHLEIVTILSQSSQANKMKPVFLRTILTYHPPWKEKDFFLLKSNKLLQKRWVGEREQLRRIWVLEGYWRWESGQCKHSCRAGLASNWPPRIISDGPSFGFSPLEKGFHGSRWVGLCICGLLLLLLGVLQNTGRSYSILK